MTYELDALYITGELSAELSLEATLTAEQVIDGTLTVPIKVEHPTYKGQTVITPTGERQVLSTEDLVLTENIIIEPVPKQYGFITYDGGKLRIT